MKKSLFPRWACLAACLSLAPLAAACGGDDDGRTDGLEHLEKTSRHETVKSDKARAKAEGATDGDLLALTKSQREFNADLFRKLSSGDLAGRNAMVSALSVHQALGMAWAGAKGETASQMAEALGFDDRTHAAQNALSLTLQSRNMPAVDEGDGGEVYDAVELSVANAFWAGKGLSWKDGFLDPLAEYYGAGVETLDFKNAPDDSRMYINAWVADRTNYRVQDLIPEGGVSPDTVSVLTNAVHFKAPWAEEFWAGMTGPGDYRIDEHRYAKTDFVRNTERLPYAEGTGWKAVQKPFRGGKLAMLFILPDTDDVDFFVEDLGAGVFDGIVDRLSTRLVHLSLPKFEFTTSVVLKDALADMGMELPFDAAKADFSGMTDDARVWIDQVIHKTFIALDEKGVEAAAATAVVMEGATSVDDPVEFKANHPFVFAIRDVATGAVLFYGKVIDPTAK